MAVMNPYQQRLLMQQLVRRDPTAIARLAGAQGGGLAGLIGGPQGGDMSLLGLVEPPQLITPGSPAPMQPGREVVAPPPPQQQQPEQVAPVGPGYRKDGAVDQAVMTPEALQGLASARSAEIEDRIRAAAVVSPKMAEMLAGREERYSKELTDIEEDQKRTGWEALAMAGMRMAQSQSPYFMSALATGLEAGLTGYSAKKAAAAERKARLQEQKENVELYREQLKMQAEDREAARVARQMGITKEQLGLTESSTRAALGLATFQPSVKVAEMAPEKERAGIEATRAGASQNMAQARFYDRGPGAGLGRSEGQTGLKTGQIISMINNATTRKTRLQAAAAATMIGRERTKLMAEIMAIDEEIRDLRQRAGLDSGAGASSGAGARDPLGIRQPRG